MKMNGIAKQNRRRFLKIAGTVAAALALDALPLAVRTASAGTGKIKIGIVGSGKVGSALGGVWVKVGHEVMFSSRHIEQDKALAAKLGPNARAGTPREAAAFGEVLMISVPYRALPEVGKDLADLIKGKVVIDTCNPFVSRDGEIATWAREKGAGLASAELLPGKYLRGLTPFRFGGARVPAGAVPRRQCLFAYSATSWMLYQSRHACDRAGAILPIHFEALPRSVSLKRIASESASSDFQRPVSTSTDKLSPVCTSISPT